MTKNTVLAIWTALVIIAGSFLAMRANNPVLLEKVTLGLIKHPLGSVKAIKFESTIDK